MKKLTWRMAVAVVIACFATPALASNLFEFDAMIAVDGAFVAPATLRDVGGGRAWVILAANAELDEDGTLEVEVVGLVLKDPPFAGVNPITQFFATLSCLDLATGDVVNINTDTFAATLQGDSEIKDTIVLPPTCVDPVVLVRGDLSSVLGNPFPSNPVGPDPADPWFAATGF